MEKYLSIGEVSRLLDIPESTLRFWQDKGIFSVEKGENNYRQYTVYDLTNIAEIAFYRNLGMPVRQMGRFNQFCLVFFLKCAELFGYIVYIIFGSDFLNQKDGIETVFLFLPNQRIMFPDGRNNNSPDVILIMLRIAGIHQTNVKRGILCIPDQLLTVAVFKRTRVPKGTFSYV